MEINKKVKMYLNESKLDRDVVNKTIDYLENTYQDIIKELTTELEKEKKKKTKVELNFNENFYMSHYGKLIINEKEVGEVFLKEQTISSDSDKIKLKMDLTVKVPRIKTDGRIYKLN